MNGKNRIVLTGFMGVGKSTVAKCLANLLKTEKIDLDHYVEAKEGVTVAELVENKGIEYFRQIETECLREILAQDEARIISLGGGTWVSEVNRNLIKNRNCMTVWLESSFEHCWRNITFSKTVRPLAKEKSEVKKLFDERQKFYCLADWHLVVKPELTSFDLAKIIIDEIL
jgi:shikimate kinase